MRCVFIFILLIGQRHPSQAQQPAGDTTVFIKAVSGMTAEFKGGEHAWLEFLMKNLQVRSNVVETGFSGRVTVKFMVSATGNVSQVTLPGTTDPAIIAEVKRVMALSNGQWTPAIACGRLVKSYKTITIFICLERG